MSTTATVTTPTTARRPRSASARRRLVGLLVCLALLVLACVLSVAVGSRVVPLHEVVDGVWSPDPDNLDHASVQARMTRTATGLLVGVALGLSGAVLQGLTRNPLGDPGLLGITSGASFSVVLAIAYLQISSPQAYAWFAFLGATVASAVVYLVGSAGRDGATPLKLALAGAAVMAAFTSLIGMVLLSRREVFEVFRFWQVGGIAGAGHDELRKIVPFLVVGAVLAFGISRSLNTLALGEDVARGLGARVGLARVVGWIAVVLLCGGATAIAGPIVFLGLAAPHVARMLTGADYRWVLPYAALIGAGFLLYADVLGRVLTRPADIDVGVMTALLGAPLFIAIVRRSRMREL